MLLWMEEEEDDLGWYIWWSSCPWALDMWVPLSAPTELKLDCILTVLANGLPNIMELLDLRIYMIVTIFFEAKTRCFYHSNLKLSLFTNSLCGSCKDETDEQNPVPSCPYFYIFFASFRMYGQIQKWDRKREEVYPARICGIPFLNGMIPYL